MNFIELCCGLGSVSLELLGAPKPPVSRFGAKTGYARVILNAMGIPRGTRVDHLVLVDADAVLLRTVKGLLTPRYAQKLAGEISVVRTMNAKELHQHLLKGTADRFGLSESAQWLLKTACSRGGIGGFKGKHKLRPNVDGFIPSRDSLCLRLLKFAGFDYEPNTTIRFCAADVREWTAFGGFVYIDPPYAGTTPYKFTLNFADVVSLAERAAKTARVVCVSEGKPLPMGPKWSYVNITGLRKGQCRTKAMSRSTEEWLSIFRN